MAAVTLIAWVGQPRTHLPQPLQASAAIAGRERASAPIARVGQAYRQLTQITPFQARQADGSSVARPIAGSVAGTTVCGQAVPQSPQKVQPPAPKSR